MKIKENVSKMANEKRCCYCDPNDCGGLQWDCEDICVVVTLQCGKFTVCNEYGDEAVLPLNYCPNCGAKMDGERKNDEPK